MAGTTIVPPPEPKRPFAMPVTSPITANLRYWDIGIYLSKKPLRNKVVHNIILG